MTNAKLVLAISSRALFDLNESHSVFEKEGVEGYRKYQIKNENNVLEPGTAFNFIQKLIALNSDKKNQNYHIASILEYQ